MVEYMHDLIEWEQQDEEMHCLGWICRTCGYLEIGEYHHQTCCRQDFCGTEPIFMGVCEPSLTGAR